MHLTAELWNPQQPHNAVRFNYIEKSARNGWGYPLHHAIRAMGLVPRNYQPGNATTIELVNSNGCELDNLILSTQDIEWPRFLEAIGDIPKTQGDEK